MLRNFNAAPNTNLDCSARTSTPGLSSKFSNYIQQGGLMDIWPATCPADTPAVAATDCPWDHPVRCSVGRGLFLAVGVASIHRLHQGEGLWQCPPAAFKGGWWAALEAGKGGEGGKGGRLPTGQQERKCRMVAKLSRQGSWKKTGAP